MSGNLMGPEDKPHRIMRATGDGVTRAGRAQKLGVIIVFTTVCGVVGLVVPMFLDRDVGRSLASALLGIVGAVFGFGLGIFGVRRPLD